jgi:hypothetical protein
MTVPGQSRHRSAARSECCFFSLGALNVVPWLILNVRSRPSLFDRRVEGRQVILHVAGRANLAVRLKRCREYWGLK